MSEVGDNIKRLCGMHLVSQEELARHVGLSKQGLNNVVVGRSQPSIVTAQKIAEAFGIGVDALLTNYYECVSAAAAAMQEAPIDRTHDLSERGKRAVERKAAKKPLSE